MATVKEVRFRPLGRPPKKGEWCRVASNQFCIASFDHRGDGSTEAVERTEVPVEVPDPVPGWIHKATEDATNLCRHEWGEHTLRIAEHFAAAYRAHVAERAKAAAERYWRKATPSDASALAHCETVIREEFLRG